PQEGTPADSVVGCGWLSIDVVGACAVIVREKEPFRDHGRSRNRCKTSHRDPEWNLAAAAARRRRDHLVVPPSRSWNSEGEATCVHALDQRRNNAAAAIEP